MEYSRREVMRLLGASAASGLLGGHSLAADGQASSAVRMPLEEFVATEARVAALRKGVREMKRRKTSDPLSWFYQAAIHGVTDDAVKKAASEDPGVEGVFRKRHWNQCPHDGENSANFLPWHRGYTYYFERILRMHTEDDSFALPYWNYTERANRKFPREFGIEHLNGNLDDQTDDNLNPLYMKERDFYFCGYEHPFATGLPLLELTDSAVDISLPMAAPVFFGDTEREGLAGGIADEDPSTRGLLESYPHDQIHRSVGGIVGDTVGAMATPPTAAFDPIFPIHHSNVDRLWAVWSCLPGKTWGRLPSAYWFDERAWFFHDTDGRVVNEPRRAYFDHRALGVRFKYEDMSCKPLALPGPAELLAAKAAPLAAARKIERLAEHRGPFAALGASRTVVPLPGAARAALRAPARAIAAQERADRGVRRVFLRLNDVRLGLVPSTGFDVHLTANADADLSRADPSFLGSIEMFRHSHRPAEGGAHAAGMGTAGAGQGESFDASRALSAPGAADAERLSLVLVPYPLLSVPGKSTVILTSDVLRVGGAEFVNLE